jgi:chromosome segregation ATPase
MSTKYTYISTTNHHRALQEAHESYNIHTSALEAKLQKARTIYKQQKTELEDLRTQILQLQHEADNLYITETKS